MSDIKQRFDPSTHATRCGKLWRWLEVEGLSNLIAVDNGRREYLMFVDHNGYAGAAIGEPESIDRFDLVPIIHKPVDLPTNLRKEIKYAAMDKDESWNGYAEKPVVVEGVEDWSDEDCPTDKDFYWRFDCFGLPKDPAGWENSLYIRTKDGWERYVSSPHPTWGTRISTMQRKR